MIQLQVMLDDSTTFQSMSYYYSLLKFSINADATSQL